MSIGIFRKNKISNVPVREMMTKAPEKIPATPQPATALPPTRVGLLGATAHNNDPTSKTTIAARKDHLIYDNSNVSFTHLIVEPV
jgi:hypothetical protein